MTDIVERLHAIRDHLRTGRFGQREVWEEWLTEAAAEIEQLQAKIERWQAQSIAQYAEIERLREENKFLRSLVADELLALEPKP